MCDIGGGDDNNNEDDDFDDDQRRSHVDSLTVAVMLILYYKQIRQNA